MGKKEVTFRRQCHTRRVLAGSIRITKGRGGREGLTSSSPSSRLHVRSGLAVTPCHVCPGEGGVTAQGARGASSVTLGVALSCWHAALLHPAPPDPAVPLPSQLFRSCHRTWLWPRHGPCPAPPSLLSAPILSPVSTLVSPVPTFIFPSPALGGSSLQTSGQLRLFPAPEGEAKPPTPSPSPYRRMRKTQKKNQKAPSKSCREEAAQLRC